MGAKVAIPLEFLLSYMVKDTEMTEKRTMDAENKKEPHMGFPLVSFVQGI